MALGYWEGGVSSASYSWGTGYGRCKLSSSVVNTSDTVCRIDLSGAVRSGNDAGTAYRISGYWVTCYINVDGRVETSAGAKWDYTNWVANVSDSWYNFSRGTSDYDLGIYCRYQGSSGSGNSGRVNGSVTIPKIPCTAPPSVSSLSGKCSSSNVVSLSWTNNSTSTGTPTSNEIQVSVDGGSYTSLKSGSLFTSYSYTGAANHKYTFRVKEVNSYGSSGWVEKTVYSVPTAPTISGLILYNNKIMFGYAAKGSYVSTNVVYQYSTNKSTWSTAKTVTAQSTITIDPSSDSTLSGYAANVKAGTGNLYFRVASYNSDGTLTSAYTTSAAMEYKVQANIYVRIPDGSSMKAVYIRK